ncbi:hypothetical protein [Paenibacillus sp. L3-i20]|uniref:hypothetical protein n=1 Tax=Paenibacillus sp. L3-i20 TaxID=2905833 RepID=UPI001EDD0AFF|nr:hypothetical protein [Paenibacillus sp. L3-i20]GKU79806.1 hypothetical protein L3i20_v242030 [Paenibacillus sp. L3-i20]
MRFIGLDPSTRTGFVALDVDGNVIVAKEIEGEGKTDPKRMATQIDSIISHIKHDDIICIEGFGFASQQAIQLGGIGWGIRMALFRCNIPFIEASPSQLKKFATGKGNTPKDGMAVPIYKRWGFENKSNNVTDAFVLAQIAFTLKSNMAIQINQTQQEVVQAIKNPPEKKKKAK